MFDSKTEAALFITAIDKFIEPNHYSVESCIENHTYFIPLAASLDIKLRFVYHWKSEDYSEGYELRFFMWDDKGKFARRITKEEAFDLLPKDFVYALAFYLDKL